MRELRIKVDIVVPLPEDTIERAQRTLQIHDEVEQLRAITGDGLFALDMKEVFARPGASVRSTMRRIERAGRNAPKDAELAFVGRAAAAAAQDSDEERASDHPIMGDAPDLAPRPVVLATAADSGGDLLHIPPELDRRVPRPAPGDAG